MILGNTETRRSFHKQRGQAGGAELGFAGSSPTISNQISSFPPTHANGCCVSAAGAPCSVPPPELPHCYGLTRLLGGAGSPVPAELPGLCPTRGGRQSHKVQGSCKISILFSSPAVLKLLKHLMEQINTEEVNPSAVKRT